MDWNCWKWCPSSRISQSPAIPPPRPPSCRKENLFAEVDYWERNKEPAKTPLKLLCGSYEDLAVNLTSSCRSDLARVRAIFHWITSFNYGDIKDEKQELNRPIDGLLGILDQDNQTINHAHFFARMARSAGLTCVVITGIAKNGSYVAGERSLHEIPERRTQWNAVLVDGEWRLLDLLWASIALVRRRVAGWSLIDVDGERLSGNQEDDSPGENWFYNNEFFFLTDPDRFICTHLPDDPDWQLLPQQLQLNTLLFEKFVYVQERFFTMGMTMLEDSHRNCKLNTVDGEVTVKFGISEHIGRLQFRYMLFKERNNGVVSDDRGEPPVNWRGCIFYQLSKEHISYVCHMPTVGKYRMDIFGRHLDREKNMDLVCSYVITCDSTDNRRFPDDPDIGWGPGTELEEAGLSAESHHEAMIDITNPHVEIWFRKKVDKEMVFWHSLKNNDFKESQLQPCATLRMCKDDVIAVLRLPKPGMYAYKLFADIRAAEGDIPNVCNYLIRYTHNEGVPTTPFPSLRWGLLGPGTQARHLGIVSTDNEVTTGIINTESPEVDLTFKMSQSDYNIFYEVGMLQPDGTPGDVVVAVDPRGKTTQIRLTLKRAGEYAFNMFVRRRSEDIRIHHVHSVLIGYSGDTPEDDDDTSSEVSNDNCQPEDSTVPVVNELTLAETDERGVSMRACITKMGGMFGFLSQLNEEESVENEKNTTGQTTRKPNKIVTYEKVHNITLLRNNLLVTVERKAAQYPVNFIKTEYVKKSCVLTVGLPKEGVYVVDVFKVFDNNRLEKKPRYHITRLVKPVETEEPKRESMDEELKQVIVEPNQEEINRERLFKKLEHALSEQNIVTLSLAIQEFREARVTNGEELLRSAERRLVFLQVSEALIKAMKNRNLEELEEAVAFAVREGFCDTSKRHLFRAKRMKARLKHIEMLRQEVTQLGQKAILELKGYIHPPPIISDVMTATLLVLGESVDQLKEWKYIARHLQPTAGQTLQERIDLFDVQKVKWRAAEQAKKLVGMYTELAIIDVSAVAVPFFRWTREVIAMVEEPMKIYKQGDVDDLQFPEPRQLDQQNPDTQQEEDPHQFGSQQQNGQQSGRQDPDPQQTSGSSRPSSSEHIPLTTMTRSIQDGTENADDDDANGDTHRRQDKTQGEKDEAGIPRETAI